MQPAAIIQNHNHSFHPVVDFNPAADKLLPLDFTAANTELTSELLEDTSAFTAYVENKLATTGCRYGIGGYNEHRTVYARSTHFDSGEEPRRLHLGTDIWGPAGTPVYAPLAGTVHSLGYNNNFGDYGATIILQHELDGLVFYSLYGHLTVQSLQQRSPGQFIPQGNAFTAFGTIDENGHWPPHLHLQLIFDMQGWQGDYPGVCRFSERAAFLANCPNPDLLLNMNRYIIV
jgi:murein DD-endopeptidase MepM/ murein hydrolase activator NlpD